MKKIRNWGDALLPPEEGKEGNNENFLTGESSNSLSNARWYIQKLVGPDKNKVEKIINILEKYGLSVPSSLRPFRKGCIIHEISDKYLVFTPDLKFITVLDYISSEYKVAIVATGVRKKVKEIFDEIRKILSS